MLKLHNDETVVLIIHKHWFAMARSLFFFSFLVLFPLALFFLIPFFETLAPNVRLERTLIAYEPLAYFTAALYVLALILILFYAWMQYYLDMWVITSKRILDITQRGLFDIEIAEIPLARVQDVTVDINGFIETVLHFGNVRIQTAGEREFCIRDVPRLYEIKDLIIKCSERARAESDASSE